MLSIYFTLVSYLQTRFSGDDRGEVSIEYVLVGGLAAIAIIAGMVTFKSSMTSWFTGLQNAVSSALPG